MTEIFDKAEEFLKFHWSVGNGKKSTFLVSNVFCMTSVVFKVGGS